ncbi:MAG: hypothetical protein WCI59_21095 [Betaproteobacteria bacterium]|jgi:hypothetical protein
MYGLVIRRGAVIDGTAAARRTADGAVQADRIVTVGAGLGRGREEIDASGRIVAPGFIDAHTQPAAVNSVPLLGHSALRASVMDPTDRQARPAEIEAMRQLAAGALQAPASTGWWSTVRSPGARAKLGRWQGACCPGGSEHPKVRAVPGPQRGRKKTWGGPAFS